VNSLDFMLHTESWEHDLFVPAFLAGLPYNTTTGTKRHHVMRFSSSIYCEHIPEEKFLTSCPGKKLYDTSIRVQSNTAST